LDFPDMPDGGSAGALGADAVHNDPSKSAAKGVIQRREGIAIKSRA
jgi:hypothetical protein